MANHAEKLNFNTFLINNLKITDLPSNCRDVSQAGNSNSGIYSITVSGRAKKDQVYCDLETDGEGWLVNY